MIEDYTINACPVIEFDDLWRASQYLPSREKVNAETKSDTHIVLLDDNEDTHVIFDWDENIDGWRLRNKIVFAVNEGIESYTCGVCKTDQDHYINKGCTKKKCKKCSTITVL